MSFDDFLRVLSSDTFESMRLERLKNSNLGTISIDQLSDIVSLFSLDCVKTEAFEILADRIRPITFVHQTLPSVKRFINVFTFDDAKSDAFKLIKGKLSNGTSVCSQLLMEDVAGILMCFALDGAKTEILQEICNFVTSHFDGDINRIIACFSFQASKENAKLILQSRDSVNLLGFSFLRNGDIFHEDNRHWQQHSNAFYGHAASIILNTRPSLPPAVTTVSEKRQQQTSCIAEILLNLDGNAEKADHESEQCIVCFNNKKNIVFQPCNHLICCVECARELHKRPVCPKCRASIEGTVKVFH